MHTATKWSRFAWLPALLVAGLMLTAVVLSKPANAQTSPSWPQSVTTGGATCVPGGVTCAVCPRTDGGANGCTYGPGPGAGWVQQACQGISNPTMTCQSTQFDCGTQKQCSTNTPVSMNCPSGEWCKH